MNPIVDPNQVISPVLKSIQNDALSPAHLICCPFTGLLQQHCEDLVRVLLCQKTLLDHCSCQSCYLYKQGHHPDLISLGAFDGSITIKVSEIRELLSHIYIGPAISPRKVVLIRSATHLNVSSANALLKALEEPPLNVNFVLASPAIATVLPTILSRCQRWPLHMHNASASDILCSGSSLFPQGDKSELLQNRDSLIRQIEQLFTGGTGFHECIKQWQQFALKDILWFLMLVYATVLKFKKAPDSVPQALLPVLNFYKDISFDFVFRQVDEINANIKLLSRGIHLNETLVLEKIFLAYQRV